MAARRAIRETEPEEDLFDPRAVARQIDRIERSVKKIERGGLNRAALVVLLSDATGLGKRTIERVLRGMDGLRARYAATPRKR